MTARTMSPPTISSALRPVGWRRALLIGAVAIGGLVLGWLGASSPSYASGSTPASIRSTKTTVVYAFDINKPADELIAAPGTKPGVVSEGDVAIINDQLTVTHAVKGGYRIIGYVSGSCTYTRVSAGKRAIENCVATAVLPKGSITAEGVVKSTAMVPQPALLAVTGGTGGFVAAKGTVKVTFGEKFETLTFGLQ
jgi:hypothetical protein